MGMAVFAGMLVATFLGVLLIPMLYVVVMKVTGGQARPAGRRPTRTGHRARTGRALR